MNGTARFGAIELRRYTLHSGKRDELIELFERHFLESQEACGMLPFAHYRDLDDPDSFVWLRAFNTMEARREALEAFYLKSDVWKAHRNAANATMVDSDNVLLLRSARPESGFETHGLKRPPSEIPATAPASFAALTISMLDSPATESLLSAFEREMLPALREIATRVAYYTTHGQPNNFHQLAVRDGEWAFVVAGVLPTAAALQAWSRVFDSGKLPVSLTKATLNREILRLAPAPRSLLR